MWGYQIGTAINEALEKEVWGGPEYCTLSILIGSIICFIYVIYLSFKK